MTDRILYGQSTKDLHRYILKGSLHVTRSSEFDTEVLTNNETSNEVAEYADSIYSCLNEYKSDDNLAFYSNIEKVKIVDISIRNFNGVYYSICEVFTNELLTKHELVLLKDEISGQYSDGFGEGFEQQDCYEYTEDDEFLNDDTGEYETGEVKFWINCSLWNHENFTLEYITEETLDNLLNN